VDHNFYRFFGENYYSGCSLEKMFRVSRSRGGVLWVGCVGRSISLFRSYGRRKNASRKRRVHDAFYLHEPQKRADNEKRAQISSMSMSKTTKHVARARVLPRTETEWAKLYLINRQAKLLQHVCALSEFLGSAWRMKFQPQRPSYFRRLKFVHRGKGKFVLTINIWLCALLFCSIFGRARRYSFYKGP